MGSRLTTAQAYYLSGFIHGWTIAHPAQAPAPLRRLIARGLIENTGIVRRGRSVFKATPAGRRALQEHDPCRPLR